MEALKQHRKKARRQLRKEEKEAMARTKDAN